MRKIYSLLLALVATLPLQAQTQDNAMYVYRNDGNFNAFLREDIDSIALSYFDLDSIKHNDPVCQVFFTPDSIYRIPIEAIDSVSLVSPKTILQPEVIDLNGDLRATLVRVEGAKLIFSKESEKNHRFKVGDKLVTLEMSDIFPAGYIGKVVEVGIENECIYVICEDVDIEEVFYSYCCMIHAGDMESVESAKRSHQALYAKDFNVTLNIPTLSKTWELSGYFDRLPNASFGGSTSVTSSLKPKFTISGCDIVDPVRGRITDITIVGEYNVENSFDLNVGISARKEFSFFPLGKEFETTIAPFLSFFFDAGLFLEGSANISYSHSLNSSYISVFNIKRLENSLEPAKPVFREIKRSDTDYKLALKGRVAGGVYLEAGIKPWLIDKNAISKVSLSADVGIEFESTTGFDFEDLKQASANTALYDAVNIADGAIQPNISLNCYAALSFHALWTPYEFNWMIGKFTLGAPIYQGGLFPHFSDLSYTWNGKLNEINCVCSISRLCPFDYEVGFAVLDFEGNKLKTEYYSSVYSRNPIQRFNAYDIDLSGIEKNRKYVIHPSIKVFGYDVLASPSIRVLDKELVDITDFTVSSSEHRDNGFTYKGSTYSYKFNTSVTLTLKDSQGVEDWGYVYRDPYGNDVLISLKEFGASCTDTRYVYYRNQAESSCTLFGYVKYEGEDEYCFDEPQTFELKYSERCADPNHVHMVDLGLSVKWACCNVGANAPEHYGGYYAWGETSEKSNYYWTYYKHWFDKDGDGNFGWDEGTITSDIAATEYDVAHVQWGGSWRMPRFSEVQELVSKCSWEWTSVNGVAGQKVTGPNGNSIFLPAAGQRCEEGIDDSGLCGLYWSSTPHEDNARGAYGLYFYSGNTSYPDDYWRNYGLSVRPVSE